MREYNLLDDYPNPEKPRLVHSNLRTIENRISASYRDINLYDGDRNSGYGGYKYDGRWVKVAQKISNEYKLNNESSFLHIGCEKGFLMHDVKNIYPSMDICGVEISKYAIENSMQSIRKNIINSSYIDMKNFKDNAFDFIYATGVIYALNITDAIKCLKEIIRISDNSFITLASYTDKKDYWLFKNWTLLGTTILLKKEWETILKHVGYKGDYCFTNAKTLNLVDKDLS